jgi:hypothetical protein
MSTPTYPPAAGVKSCPCRSRVRPPPAHSEYSITDGLTRIDEAIAQAAADGQPALAITDLANLFGMVKFYTAGARQGRQAHHRLRCLDRRRGCGRQAERAPARLLLLVKNRAGYLRLCELLSAAYLAPRRHGRAEITRGQLGQGDNSGLIALSGGPLGDIGQMLAAGKLDQADVRAQAWARLFPGAYYIEVQRPGGAMDGAAADEVLVAASADLAARLGLPLVATHPVQFLGATTTRRTRRASASPRATCWATSGGPSASARSSTSRPGRDGRTVRRPARGLAELGGDRPPLQPERGTGQEPPAGFPDAGRRAAGSLSSPASRMPAWRGGWNCCIPMRPSARSSAAPTSSASISRSRPSSRWASPATS